MLHQLHIPYACKFHSRFVKIIKLHTFKYLKSYPSEAQRKL